MAVMIDTMSEDPFIRNFPIRTSSYEERSESRFKQTFDLNYIRESYPCFSAVRPGSRTSQRSFYPTFCPSTLLLIVTCINTFSKQYNQFLDLHLWCMNYTETKHGPMALISDGMAAQILHPCCASLVGCMLYPYSYLLF